MQEVVCTSLACIGNCSKATPCASYLRHSCIRFRTIQTYSILAQASLDTALEQLFLVSKHAVATTGCLATATVVSC